MERRSFLCKGGFTAGNNTSKMFLQWNILKRACIPLIQGSYAEHLYISGDSLQLLPNQVTVDILIDSWDLILLQSTSAFHDPEPNHNSYLSGVNYNTLIQIARSVTGV